MSQQQLSPRSLLHSLYCDERDVVDVSLFEIDEPQKLLEVDLFWEDEELVGLLSKQDLNPLVEDLKKEQSLAVSRRLAVDWMRRVRLHYSFSASTAVLAVNYFDRFVSMLWGQMSSPWMSQLAAVACLSLAAKMEETQVPLLLDLQVGESEYVFEAKTIQRMEISVLSTLEWRMSPVTPLSFFDHFVRRIGCLNLSQGEFLLRCESVLLCVLYDDRYVEYVPSVVAGSVIIHVIRSVDPCNATEYQDKLCDILDLDQARMESCSLLIMEAAFKYFDARSNEQQFGTVTMPSSPNGVMDVSFSSDSIMTHGPLLPLGLHSHQDSEPLLKKCKTNS